MNVQTASQEELEKMLENFESQLAASNPGINEVMRLYAEADTAVRNANAYFAQLDNAPIVSNSNAVGA